MARRHHSAKATASSSSACTCPISVLGGLLITEASNKVLVWLCRDSSLHVPAKENQVGECLWCEKCILMDSLRKQVRELKKEVTRLRNIHEDGAFINLVQKETSSIMAYLLHNQKLFEDKEAPYTHEGGSCQLVTSDSR